MTPLIQDEVGEESVFDQWASVYDAQPNPLLSLEESELGPLLPKHAKDIMDIGCGTGRWLTRLEKMAPASLIGIDSSARMLAHARRRMAPSTTLHSCDGRTLFPHDSSQDLLLASFFLSYLPSIHDFAAECQRVMRPGASLFISDMHPATAKQFGWSRSFHANGNHVAVDPNAFSLQFIVDTFIRSGLELEILLEPTFGTAEEELFRSAGRIVDFEEFAQSPAIYLAKFSKPFHRHSLPSGSTMLTLHFAKARVAMGPARWMKEEATIQGRAIRFASNLADTESFSLDLTGYSILPGLINAHDHLEFGLFPRLGRERDAMPYQNAAEWAREIQNIHRDVIDLHRRIPLQTRLWWGALRNLLCGVTTVCHHNPAYADFKGPDFPVDVVSQLGWAHSLAFEEGLEQKHNQTPPGTPFILHAAEGTDEQSRGEVLELDRRKLLNNRTVLVHGVALTASEVALINDRGSALVVCPTSNRFLFRQAPSIDVLQSIRRLALGSDSSITADGDLLHEIRWMHANSGLDENCVYELVTSGAADVLCLRNGEGAIVPGKAANVIAVRSTGATPAATLCRLTVDDVELVLRSGILFMASQTIYEKLSKPLRAGLQCLIVGEQKRWVRAPLANLFASAEAVLGRGNLMLGGRRLSNASPL